METLKLNTSYDLEYYKKGFDKYLTKALELAERCNDLGDERMKLFNENILLMSKIKELENKRAYTVKLQISK